MHGANNNGASMYLAQVPDLPKVLRRSLNSRMALGILCIALANRETSSAVRFIGTEVVLQNVNTSDALQPTSPGKLTCTSHERPSAADKFKN